MRLLPRSAVEPTPLSPHVEALLRGLPRVEAPPGGLARLMEAYEDAYEAHARGQVARALPRERWGAMASAAAIAAAVLVALAGLSRTEGTHARSEARGEPAAARVWRVVDDPRLAMASASERLGDDWP